MKDAVLSSYERAETQADLLRDPTLVLTGTAELTLVSSMQLGVLLFLKERKNTTSKQTPMPSTGNARQLPDSNSFDLIRSIRMNSFSEMEGNAFSLLLQANNEMIVNELLLLLLNVEFAIGNHHFVEFLCPTMQSLLKAFLVRLAS